MVSCNEFITELGNLLDNEVAGEFRRKLESHLVECRNCEVLYDSTCKAIKIVSESTSFEYSEPAAEPLVNKVMTRIRCNAGSLKK